MARRDDPGLIVLCCLAAGVYFGYRAWSSFQAERSLPGLTEENTAQAMSWAKMTACPPVGQGCFEVPQSIMEARQTCTWSGLCRIGAIVLKNDRSAPAMGSVDRWSNRSGAAAAAEPSGSISAALEVKG